MKVRFFFKVRCYTSFKAEMAKYLVCIFESRKSEKIISVKPPTIKIVATKINAKHFIFYVVADL